MASDFLKRKAAESRERVTKANGAKAYGGTEYQYKPKATPSNIDLSGMTGTSRKSRDDAGVRNAYAKREDALTGGAMGDAVRRINTLAVNGIDNNTDVRRYNSALEELQKILETDAPSGGMTFHEDGTVAQNSSPIQRGSNAVTDLLGLAGRNTMAGVTQFNSGLAKFADWLLPDVITPDAVQNAMDWYKVEADRAEQKTAAENYARGGQLGQVAGSLYQGTIASAPQAIMAFITGGASKAVEALNVLNRAGMSPTVLTSISEAMKQPSFWTSFAMTAGNDYEDAIANGASEMEALATAYISSMLGAGIEIGGGVEEMAKNAGRIGLRDIAKSAFSEGLEEVEQGITTGLTNKAVYDRNRAWYSATDDTAIINPSRMVQEFAGGAIAGGLLSGGGAIANNVLSRPAATAVQHGEARTLGENSRKNYEQAKAKDAGRTADFDRQYDHYNKMGESGIEFDQIPEVVSATPIDDAVKQGAYLAGKNDGVAKATALADRALQGESLTDAEIDSVLGHKETRQHFESAAGVKFSQSNAKNRTTVREYIEAEQKKPRLVKNDFSKEFGAETEDMLDRLAKRGGAQIEIVEIIADDSAGKYLDGKIQISAEKLREDREGTLRAVVMHEMTHHIETSGQYEQLKSGIESYLKSKGVDVDYELEILAEEYEANGVDLLEDDRIWREYIAKNVETLLSDEDSVRYLARENRGLFDKIREFLRDLVMKIKGTQDEKTVRELLRIYDHALDTVDAHPENRYKGEQHLFVRTNNAETAETMERDGASRDEIWQATGMIRDAKGNWITEIDDSGASWHRLGDAKLQGNPDYVRFRDLENKMLNGDITEEELAEANQIAKNLRGVPMGNTLQAYLKHPELYEKYPELADLAVMRVDQDGLNRGSYNKQARKIEVSKRDDAGERNTAIHEAQHAIQDLEGRPGGASREYWQARIDSGEKITKYGRKIAEADAEYRRLFEAAPAELKEKIRELNRARLAGDEEAIDRIEDELWNGEYADEYAEIDFADWDRRQYRESDEPLTAEDAYFWTAGEVEARAAVARSDMTAEERKKITPNLGLDRVVFAEDYGYYSMSSEETANIRDQIRDSQSLLNDMAVVSVVSTSGIDGTETRTVLDEIMKALEKGGLIVEHPEIGEIQIEKKKVNRSLNYKEKKPAAEKARRAGFLALKDVLKNGIVVDGHNNHKGRNYPTKTIAAPVEINGKRGNMAVVVMRTDGSNRYKVHRILTPDGETFALPEMANAEANTVGAFTDNSLLSGGSTPAIASASNNILTRNGAENNGNTAQNSGQTSVGRSIDELRAQGQQMTPEERKAYVEASRERRAKLRELSEKYGEIPQGERPAREIALPKQTDDKHKVSQTVRTILEAKATPDALVPTLEEMTVNGDFSYEVYTDKAAMADAEATVRDKGYRAALIDWSVDVGKGNVSKANTALGWTLYNAAANEGDVKTAVDVLNLMVQHQRSAAQAVQATRILKKLSPDGQLYGIQRSVHNLQEELQKKYGKKAPKLEISPKMAEDFLNARTDEERAEAERKLYMDIGRQMPSRFVDRWNAWRYLAMLGNARTHVRNVVGNAGFAPVVATKNATATVIEAAVSRAAKMRGTTMNRTKKTVLGTAVTNVLNKDKPLIIGSKADRALLKAAWADYDNVQAELMAGGKYNDAAAINDAIREGQHIFDNTGFKPWDKTVGWGLEKARRGNSAALEAEDMWFARPHYAYALAQFCKAQNISAEQLTEGRTLGQARPYAIKEAQKATYRDTNDFSQAISDIGRYSGKNVMKKGISTVMEGILPFRKTPANILVRGVEYSPLGLLKGLTYDLAQVKRGNKSGAEVIDNIAAGLTGTGLLMAGIWLASVGLVRGSGGDDDNEKSFKTLQGHQTYALELPDGESITLDWLAPECLPFFVGVNLWEQKSAENESATLSDILQAVSNVSEPMLEMSCLQSLNDLFDTLSGFKDSDLAALPSIVASAATSYLTQGLPTISGQVERIFETERMTTYTEKNAFLTSDLQYLIGKASGKLPGDYAQIPYIDAWGRAEGNGSTLERALNNLLNPAYMSKIETSAMEEELLRLYNVTGKPVVLPSRAGKTISQNYTDYNLSGTEYVKLSKQKGQDSYKLVTDFTKSQIYKGLSDEIRAEVVGEIYSYANQIASAAVWKEYKLDSKVSKAQEAEKKYGISPATYLSLYVQKNDIESFKEKKVNKDGEHDTITHSKDLQIMKLIQDTKELNDSQRQALYEYFDISTKLRKYNRTKVAEELNKMRKQAK